MKFKWQEKLLEEIGKAPHETLLSSWLSLLLGLFILGIAALDSVPKLRAYHWVAGEARVVSTDMYQRSGRSHSWCGRIRYAYLVDGRSYKSRELTSSIISDQGCHLDKARVAAWLAARPAGTSIRIFYDPAAPERAAIVREGLKWHDFLFWLMAIFVLAFSAYCIVHARRVLRRPKPANRDC
ncbi:DUF3592 domain-containing protein [Duganella sp. sic0402]|uniref:DUF3592 domain-containing protein n=1 Tax=Duganella sp. sic0402 TaxID=2854786 RepID=UPI001C47B0F0|nr:DUF3592 domain-containing protein [Duganella sp. sic0402]MBV7535006.1 DUF3592 domain-containing protein [Duganella sp. sic0402]